MEFLDDTEHREMNFKPFLKLLTLTKPANAFGIFKFEHCLDNLNIFEFQLSFQPYAAACYEK